MLNTGFDHARPYAADSLLDMVRSAAAAHGSGTAVRCGASEITYAELMAAAETNAAMLRGQGVRRKDMVLCALGTGIELPVAWLATMMLGAVIVPIDIGWPALRLRAVAATTDAAIAIAGDDGHEALLAAGVRVVGIRLGRHDSRQTLAACAGSDGAGPDLVYGFFTSGSTGVPKCALNHHAGLANRFRYMTRRFGQRQVVYQNSAPLFDSSIWQMLWPLTGGSVSVLPARRGRWDLDTVVEDIARHGVTMTDFVPTLFKLLVRGLESGSVARAKLASLRHLLIGGEEIDAPSVHSFRRLLPQCRVINTYGHTEASIGMVFHEVHDEDGQHIPLGRPIDNTHVRIVDPSMRVLVDGELGEIVVGGVCVGAGYLNLPQLTARAFVANPFPDVPGAIVYRTGDMGRVRADGLLEYAGRADDQVKVRGVRIELGELSLAMKACFDDVSDAVALMAPAANGDPELALAYAAPAEIEVCDLRRALANHLPMTHMPRRVLWLASLPVSPNGKLDRKRIVDLMAAQSAPATIAPIARDGAAGMLEMIVHCYRGVLLLNDIGPESDFFDNGGDSLAAVNLSLMLAQACGVTVPVTRHYEYPTPRALAKFLNAGGNGAGQGNLSLPEVEYSNTGVPAAISRRVLLTGATGCIGVHVLECLLRTTTLEVSVLLRGASSQAALDRLASAYRDAHRGQALPLARIKVLLGDLAAPKWGLPLPVWEHQAAEIDEVIHCGAEVNFLLPASQLFAPNVLGTAGLIQFCREGRAKRVHHVSSLAAKLKAVEVHGGAPAGTTGYGYTKYMADRLIVRAQAQGLSARIYRVDDVMPSICAGHVNQRSLVHMLLSCCLRLGVAPAGCGELGLLPIDALARWLCGFVGAQACFGGAPALVDVVGQQFVPFDMLVWAVAGKLGRESTPIGYDAFLALLRRTDDPRAALLHDMLPPAGSGRVAFTHPLPVADRQARCAAVPNGQQLVANLGDFALYLESLARTLDGPAA
jgi:amino acid adenylation domain-containing protein/thioester reductase-like protein